MQLNPEHGLESRPVGDPPPRPRSGSTEVCLQRFAVPYEYPVCFTDGIFHPENTALVSAIARLEPRRTHRLLVVVDGALPPLRPGLEGDVTAYVAAHADRLELAGPLECVPGGEAAKNDPALVDALHARLQEHRMDRQSCVVVVGGGAVLDMVGYAVATAHRGLRLVRVPSTVLSQNDSGVGVKNGINAFGTKNFLGCFAPPFAVLNDFELLCTLSERDLRAGMAEAVKVALIRDSAFFVWLEEHAEALARFEASAMRVMIRRCAELHMRHIATGGDPFEFGSSRPLDFGHWAAHRLESLTHNGLRHGEAVAIGMVLDSRYSLEKGLLERDSYERIRGLLERLGLPTTHAASTEVDASGARRLLVGLDEFREHLGGELAITLLEDLGTGVEVHDIDRDAMERALLALEHR